jgi:two-component system nitrate/nitrite response regulator NarL
MMPIDTFLLIPSRLSREGMRRLLTNSRFNVVGDAADIDGLKHAITAEAQLGCLIVDVDGFDDAREAIAEIRATVGADCRLVTLTSQSSCDVLYEVFAGSADALLHNEISIEAMLESLDLVVLGEKVFPSSLTVRLLEGINAATRSQTLSPGSAQKLSEREVDILRYLVAGGSNKVIANSMDITETTVKTHLKNIQRKLNVRNRTQAAIWALNQGLAQPHDGTGNGAKRFPGGGTSSGCSGGAMRHGSHT